jgi:hypothetical protein
MIKLPNYEKAFDYENDFYLSCESTRVAKSIAQYILFEKTIQIDGDIVECGVFKGASFSRFAMYRKIHNLERKKLIGFDTFGDFPETQYEKDKKLREDFILEAGAQSISKNQISEVLLKKGCDKNTDFIQGDITETVPKFVRNNPSTKISLLNLDVDIYEPTVTILEHLYPLISPGGVLILDDYETFHGETNAINEYFQDENILINKPIFADTPYFIIKQ